MIVYILTRISDGDSVVIDGVYTTEEKAEKYKEELMKDFGVKNEDDSEFNWEIHKEKVL